MRKRTLLAGFDLWILGILAVLLPFGLLMVYDASVVAAARDFGDPYYYVRNQATWIGIGLAVFVFTLFFDYHHYIYLSRPLLIVSILLLGLVFLPGVGITALGATRWISLGPVTLQPSEIVKLVFILYLARWLSRSSRPFASWQELLLLSLLAAFVVGLILVQPDMGTALIVAATTLLLFFVAGIPFRYLAILLPVILFGVLASIRGVPYRVTRLMTFLHPFEDIKATGYHMYQALLAIGSGGFFGVGLGQSRQKYAYLPEATTDSIFAIIAEEVGFFGASLLVLLFLFLLSRAFRIAHATSDRYGQYVALGIAITIGVQAFINFGSMVAAIPLTGAPLPLISYGGSSMVVTLASLGILLKIGQTSQRRHVSGRKS